MEQVFLLFAFFTSLWYKIMVFKSCYKCLNQSIYYITYMCNVTDYVTDNSFVM